MFFQVEGLEKNREQWVPKNKKKQSKGDGKNERVSNDDDLSIRQKMLRIRNKRGFERETESQVKRL